MKVRLGKFSYASITALFRGNPASGVQVALVHYARRLKSGRPPADLPRYALNGQFEDLGTTFEVPIDGAVQAVLEQDAARNGVRLSDVLTHAVLVYLADMDATGNVDALDPAVPRMDPFGRPWPLDGAASIPVV